MGISREIQRCLKRDRDIGRKAVLSDVKTVQVYPALKIRVNHFTLHIKSDRNHTMNITLLQTLICFYISAHLEVFFFKNIF